MIIEMGEALQSAKYIDPKTMLEKFLCELENIDCNKAMIVYLDDTDDKYNVGFVNARLTCSEMIALLRTAEIVIHRQMGYLPYPPDDI